MVVPGYCRVDPDDPIVERLRSQQIDLVIGTTDCRRLPELFGGQKIDADLSEHRIEIIAEINHVPRMSVEQVVAIANGLLKDGADRIDLGCDPQNRCLKIGDYVRAVRDLDAYVSIDSFDVDEVHDAVAAGVDLVLSVNASNRHQAIDFGCEVVAIPNTPSDLESLFETVEFLNDLGIPFRADPILEPIGAGLTNSIVRYHATRKRYPEMPMMMGIGNLTELTDVDSAGVNFILLGLCEEMAVTSVLTTQVINWARSSVAECAVARRLVHYSVANGIPPKRISGELIMLRDDCITPHSPQVLDEMSASIRDNNYRLFAQDAVLRIISADLDVSDTDPFRLFETLMQQTKSDNIDPGHAFYLGYEMAKANLALQLGKQYEQDQSLDWGMLTVPEDLHRLARTSRHRKTASTSNRTDPGSQQSGNANGDQ